MTREVARIKVEQLDNYLSHTCQDYGERDHEAMMMAIQALEQEPVLDKIRAEIIQSIQNGTLKIESGNEELFCIIDKYKAETEET